MKVLDLLPLPLPGPLDRSLSGVTTHIDSAVADLCSHPVPPKWFGLNRIGAVDQVPKFPTSVQFVGTAVVIELEQCFRSSQRLPFRGEPRKAANEQVTSDHFARNIPRPRVLSTTKFPFPQDVGLTLPFIS